MKDKDGNEVVFVINNEEGEYIKHLKKFALCDNYPRPNRHDFNLGANKIGRFVKVEDLKNNNNNLNNLNAKETNLTTNKKKRNIHEGHRKRLRDIFNNVDPTTLPENQILELMLSFAQPQKDVNPLAHALLDEFGNFSNVLNASVDDLKKIKGVGEVLASYIHFCSKIPAVVSKSKTNFNKRLVTPADIIDFVRSIITFSNQEEFYYLCLDNKGKVLCVKNLGTGTASKLYIDNRLLLQNILKYPTNSVVVCHTHPNGNPEPSVEDKNFTLNLFSLLEKINIKLIDHIILSPDDYFSFFLSGTEALGKNASLRSKILFGIPPYLFKEEY